MTVIGGVPIYNSKLRANAMAISLLYLRTWIQNEGLFFTAKPLSSTAVEGVGIEQIAEEMMFVPKLVFGMIFGFLEIHVSLGVAVNISK